MYVPIIGMEIHVEPNTASKMFCRCKNDPFDSEPNAHICPICLAHPGTLPVPNKEALRYTVLLGKALGCSIRPLSKFDRKQYMYPDLPKGYQISQYDEPIAEFGKIELSFELDSNHRDEAQIGIRRVHLEEDAAKLLHGKDGASLVDFNRAGVPLIEIVTDPDFESALEAKTYCQELRTLLRFLEISNADMEKGQMRCEANISMQEAGSFEIIEGEVRPLAGKTLNPKVELKNLNSFKAVERGILFEMKRQSELLDKGESWHQQTRGWDEDKGETVLQRVKHNAADYRYFPEPDIPPFEPEKIIGDCFLPELPLAKRKRFHQEYGFSYADAQLLSADKKWAEFAEEVMSELIEWLHSMPEIHGSTDEIREERKRKIIRLASSWITNRLMGLMTNADTMKISPENFAEFICLLYTEKINSSNAQKLLIDMFDYGSDVDPSHIMEEKGYGQVRDTDALQTVVDEVIRSYPNQVEQFKSGKDPIIKFLIGMGMKATEGTADPKMLEEMLRESLREEEE